MFESKTIERDLGFKEIRKRLKEIKGSFVTVGVHEGSGSYDNDVTIAEVAFFNEFGTETAPERSFMRSTMDENKSDLLEKNKKLKDDILSLRKTTKQALSELGFEIKERIQGKIEDLREPPNAPSTIKGKPTVGDNPLVHTRTLKRSINYEVNIRS
jgi:hypothetical protein